VNSDSSLFLDDPNTDSLGADFLSIALIGPDEESRRAAASAISGCPGNEIREFSAYPASLDELPLLLEQHYGVIIIDLDSDPEYALELVEGICIKGAATVMVYSAKADSELLVRCMRAGAREFLTLPFAQGTVAEALVRASARRPVTRPPKKAGGRLLAFLGAKGGDGVTTLACNFAVSLAQESGQSTLLIDLDLPLGDAALNLGVSAEYSTINALQNAGRLDSSFLSKLLVKHTSGVSVLAAPGKFPQFDAPNDAIDKLLTVARQDFENVVIDMGSRLDLMGTGLFKDGATIYLVIQAGIAGLRNSNRLISQYFNTDVPKLEIVLNRFQSRALGVAEDQITKALTRPAQWKIPNDYAAVRRMQHTAIPLALEDSPISRLIRQMARCACGMPPAQEKASGFSLKKISRSISAKISSPEETPTYTQLDLSPQRDKTTGFSTASQPEPPANLHVSPANSAPEEYEPAATPPLLTAGDNGKPDDHSEPNEDAAQSAPAPIEQSEPETRVYQGATYVRGDDGRWHLQITPARDSNDEAASTEKETPAIEWSTPDPIVYGTALSDAQLNATASVPGTFAYSPAADEVLTAGDQTLSAAFTPEDAASYAKVESTVSLTVSQATPIIAWSTPASVVYGNPLSATQLNAMASVPGTFDYTPDLGEVLLPGVQTLSAEFAPKDDANYTSAQATVSLIVTQAEPAITWPAPAPIAFGTALSIVQLNAAASAPGTLVYTPALGEVLSAGEHTLSVVFTPADNIGYNTAKASVSLAVTKATPIVTWPAPAAISHGTALGTAQLNATALVPGTLIYTPGADEVLLPGTHSLLATFMPADSLDYTSVQASVQLTVTKATQSIPLPAPDTRAFDSGAYATELKVEPEPVAAKAPSLPAEKSVHRPKSPPEKAASKTSVKEPVKAAQKPPVKAPAKATVKVAQKHPPKGPSTPMADAPTNALVKVGAHKGPIEVGPGLDLMGSAVLEDGTTIYLVMKPGSSGVANSNRLVSQFLAAGGPKPDFVINRFEPRTSGVAEGQGSSTSARPVRTPFSRVAGQLAPPDSDLPAISEKRTGFSLKGFGRSIWSKLATQDRAPSMTRLGLAADPGDARTPTGEAQPDFAERNAPTRMTPVDRTESSTEETAGRSYRTGAQQEWMQAASAPSQQDEPKTRTYRGATYVKGEDGQWHLQQSKAEAAHQEAALIQLPSSTPTASAARPSDSRPVLAKAPAAAAKKPARKAKPVAKKAPAKASNKNKNKKKPAKPAQKPAVKSTTKRSVKAAQKPAAKAPAKRLAKAVAKPTAKTSAKLAGKSAAAKPKAKAPAKSAGKKATAKPVAKAPARKPVPARKKTAVASIPKVQARKVTVAKPPVIRPVPESDIKVPLREPIAIEPARAGARASEGEPGSF
jgi:pilus assembly protein CpaE